MHYHSNMATMLRVGEWMDYLKEQGVYDNTRIIIVADHGRKLKLMMMRVLSYTPCSFR
jgi:arylsulfatase A-like enzyme